MPLLGGRRRSPNNGSETAGCVYTDSPTQGACVVPKEKGRAVRTGVGLHWWSLKGGASNDLEGILGMSTFTWSNSFETDKSWAISIPDSLCLGSFMPPAFPRAHTSTGLTSALPALFNSPYRSSQRYLQYSRGKIRHQFCQPLTLSGW